MLQIFPTHALVTIGNYALFYTPSYCTTSICLEMRRKKKISKTTIAVTNFKDLISYKSHK